MPDDLESRPLSISNDCSFTIRTMVLGGVTERKNYLVELNLKDFSPYIIDTRLGKLILKIILR